MCEARCILENLGTFVGSKRQVNSSVLSFTSLVIIFSVMKWFSLTSFCECALSRLLTYCWTTDRSYEAVLLLAVHIELYLTTDRTTYGRMFNNGAKFTVDNQKQF